MKTSAALLRNPSYFALPKVASAVEQSIHALSSDHDVHHAFVPSLLTCAFLCCASFCRCACLNELLRSRGNMYCRKFPKRKAILASKKPRRYIPSMRRLVSTRPSRALTAELDIASNHNLINSQAEIEEEIPMPGAPSRSPQPSFLASFMTVADG